MSERALMRSELLALLLLSSLAVPALSETPRQMGLLLELEVPRDQVAAGEPLELAVKYRNTSGTPFFLFRDADIGGRGHIAVTATKGSCVVDLPQVHFYLPPESIRFFFFPLLEGRVLEERIRLNDVRTRFFEFPLRSPGVYELQATLVSEKVDARWSPVWQGLAASKPEALRLEGARTDSLATWRAGLTRCLAGDCQAMEGATNYFSLVRDSEAADLLARIFRSKPMPSVAHALAAQRRQEDASVLRGYAKTLPIADQRIYYEKAAQEAGQPDPCE